MLLGIIFFAVLFGIMYVVLLLVASLTVGRRYSEWVTSQATKIFEGAFNIGLGAYMLNDTGRQELVEWLADLLDMKYSSAETLYKAFVFVGALALAVGITSICWALIEVILKNSAAPDSAPASVPKGTSAPKSDIPKATVTKTATSDSDVFCPRCGARVSKNCVICPGCGQMISKQKTAEAPAAQTNKEKKAEPAPEANAAPRKKGVFCTDCGKELKPGQTICPNCNSWNLDNI